MRRKGTTILITAAGHGAGRASTSAADLARSGLSSNALCPGTVDSPSLRGRAAPVQAAKDCAARQPIGRLASTDAITPMAVFLLPDESRLVTKPACLVDGGVTI